MKMPVSWLNEYITPDVSLKDYMEDLTMSGSKVEGADALGEEISNVLIGEIIKIDKHPDADKLCVCQIKVFENEELIQIVTGATNVFEGAKVPVAMHKSTIAGGVKITRGNLRGVKSNGMLCSVSELGVTASHVACAIEDGILILPNYAEIGTDIRDFLGLNDHVVEFEITSNRPDCMSILGLVRETFATYGKKFCAPVPSVKCVTDDNIENYLSVDVSSDLCNRYISKVVKNVKIAPSPQWLANRLSACGIRPVNNIVDITNYVLLEYGQPMHAFDYSTLSGKKINVRMAHDGEEFTTLDDTKRTLDSSMLVICDGDKTSAVAGVMGGLDSEIRDNTQTVVFESANFDGTSVRLTSKKLGLRTESSGKFEKGLDPENAYGAIMRACELVNMLECGDVVDGIIDVYKNPKESFKMPLECDKINALLGSDISEEKMVEILENLDFTVSNNIITVPSFRDDVRLTADVAEEIARIYGYNNITSSSFAGQTVSGGLNPKQLFLKDVSSHIRSLGFDEIMTYSFISEKAYDKVSLPENRRISTVISNPLGEDLSIMRTTTVPSMMDVICRNVNFRNQQARLYEIATIYLPVTEDGKPNLDVLPEEKKIITISSYGCDDFYAFKGYIEALLAQIKAQDISFEIETENPIYHTGRCAKILSGDTVIGVLGNIHPVNLENYGLNTDVLMCEIDFELLNLSVKPKTIYKKLPKFPASTRDISFVCDMDIPVASLEKCIKKSIPDILEDVKLFDVFISDKIGKDKKSVAYSIVMRKEDATLTDEECDSAVKSAVTNLEKDFSASLRS